MFAHIVEMDDRGRILIPKRVRKSIGSRRFLLAVSSGKIELIPLDDPMEAFKRLKGSRRFPFSWERAKGIAEKMAEEEVTE